MQRELERLLDSIRNRETDLFTLTEVTVSPDDLRLWKVTINGPKESVYQDKHFIIRVSFSDEYPFEPPILQFVTKIYHPNVDEKGNICMDALKMPPNVHFHLLFTFNALLERDRGSLLTMPTICWPPWYFC